MAMGVGRCVLAVSVVATLLATLTHANPLSYFPLNSQLPPVARISQPFSFSFSPLTFSSPLPMTYRLDDAPGWLSIDGPSRRLFGTPRDDDVPPGDVVGIPIALVADDETGSTTANVTLVVSRKQAPTVAVPLSQQLGNFGPYSPPSSLLLHPSKPFSFSFARDTFRADADPGLNYYAVSGDNAPLPSWIRFDAANLTFSGETPPFESLVQPPQTFAFQLVASDIVGFASTSIPFSVVVGNHELTADAAVIKLNATQGRPFEYADLPQVLKFDKGPLEADDVATIDALDLPPWLSFDTKTWKLSGTPDSDADSTNVTIAVVDKYTDSLNLTVSIEFATPIFVTDLPNLNITTGSDLSFDLKRYLFKPSDDKVTIEMQPDEGWAHFDTSTMILSGTVPEIFATPVRVMFNATSRRTKRTEVKNMNVNIASLSPTSSAQPNPTESTKPQGSDNDASSRNLLWLILLPILLFAIALVILFFYLRRRRLRRNKVPVVEVSAPVPGSFRVNDPENPADNSLHDMRNMVDIGPPPPSDGGASVHDSHAPATSSNLRASQTTSDPNVRDSLVPHAMAMHARAKKSPENSTIVETRSSWLAGQVGGGSLGKTQRGSEVSLLSDTSIGTGEVHIAITHPSAIDRRSRDGAFPSTLEVPMVANSSSTQATPTFSIQATPEIAYTAGRKYDHSSDDDVPPAVGYTRRQRSGLQQESGLGIRGVGNRLSQAWKRGSGSRSSKQQKRSSNLSSSTSQTTRTSILTSGISGTGEEEATTSTNVIAKPTIIHIPSRPGDARQVSRRTDESTALFGGRSLTKSPRNFGLVDNSPPTSAADETPKPPPALRDFTAMSRDSDSSWDRIARNSLGIAYKDLIKPTPKVEKTLPPPRSPLVDEREEDNWRVHRRSQDLMSPDLWPHPSTFESTIGTATSTDASIQTPSPNNEWPKPTARAFPETPTRASRAPLANFLDGSYSGSGEARQGLGTRSGASKRSWKTARSVKSVKSVKSLRSVRGDEDEDEDVWEDVRPPETVDGWDDDEQSEASFVAYI
ncbi:hypothetical protein F4779DRAFT_84534 [Xylariaceae sp. FL0662B]|nr:hypothetical protein F4779DRAFT_84534 [Xylariaceae sp. FL0662B]